MGSRVAFMHPINPLVTKTHSQHHLFDTIPRKTIKSLLRVNLNHEISLSPMLNNVDNLKGHHSAIWDTFSLNESLLVF